MWSAPTRPASGPQRRLEAALRARGISEWERDPRDIGGAAPDLLFRHRELAVFVDGCQWHGCKDHWKPARSATHGLSRERVLRQQHTDRVSRGALRARGMRVLAFWEHELRGKSGAMACAARVVEALR